MEKNKKTREQMIALAMAQAKKSGAKTPDKKTIAMKMRADKMK